MLARVAILRKQLVDLLSSRREIVLARDHAKLVRREIEIFENVELPNSLPCVSIDR